METVHLYATRTLDKENVERKLSDLSHIFNRCNIVRGMVIDKFTRIGNPFDIPEIEAAFENLIKNRDDFAMENNKVLNPQWENQQWGHLCTLCQNEIKAANKELSQILKTGEGTQMTAP